MGPVVATIGTTEATGFCVGATVGSEGAEETAVAAVAGGGVAAG